MPVREKERRLDAVGDRHRPADAEELAHQRQTGPRRDDEMPVTRAQVQERDERERGEPDRDRGGRRRAEKAVLRQALGAVNEPVVQEAVDEHPADRYPQEPPRRPDRGQERAHHADADQAAGRAPAQHRAIFADVLRERGGLVEREQDRLGVAQAARTRGPRAAPRAGAPSSRYAARGAPALAPRACDTETLTDVSTPCSSVDDDEEQVRAEAAGRERVGAERSRAGSCR